MEAFQVLGDPIRRRILEHLDDESLAAGVIAARIGAEFGIRQAAVSQHLRILRDEGFVAVLVQGNRRIYSLQTEPFRAVDAWLNQFRDRWTGPLDALATEVARGKRDRTEE